MRCARALRCKFAPFAHACAQLRLRAAPQMWELRSPPPLRSRLDRAAFATTEQMRPLLAMRTRAEFRLPSRSDQRHLHVCYVVALGA
eukprot:IDg13714t1